MKTKKNLYTKIFNSNFFYTGIGIILLIISYIILSTSLKTALVPKIDKIIFSMGELLKEKSFYKNFFTTIFKLLFTTTFTFIFAVVLALISANFKRFVGIIKPFIVVLKSFPTICILLILISITKFSEHIVLFLVVFPIVYEGQLERSQTIIKQYEYDLKLDGITRWNRVVHIILPLSYKGFIILLLQSVGLGFKSLIMAEVVTGSSTKLGIGNFLNSAYINSNYNMMFAIAFYTLIFIIVIDCILEYLKYRLSGKEEGLIS